MTLVGDYSQSQFPLLAVTQDAAVGILDVSIGTQSPGANGDLQVAGVLDVLESVGNLGSALNVTDGGTIDLGGQAVTADSLTLTDGSLADGTLSSGARTVLSGSVSTNLTGSGGLVKEGTGTVVLSGNNNYLGGTTVLTGTLIITSASSLPSGSSLIIGAGGTFEFDPTLAAGPPAGGLSASAATSDTSCADRCGERSGQFSGHGPPASNVSPVCGGVRDHHGRCRCAASVNRCGII